MLSDSILGEGGGKKVSKETAGQHSSRTQSARFNARDVMPRVFWGLGGKPGLNF